MALGHGRPGTLTRFDMLRTHPAGLTIGTVAGGVAEGMSRTMQFQHSAWSRRAVLRGASALAAQRVLAQTVGGPQPVFADEAIGRGAELFVDRRRVSSSSGITLRMHSPVPAGPAIRFDRPWEGSTSAYVTVFEDGGLYRMYYRGSPGTGASERTCYAESDDGAEWRKPDLGLFDWQGSARNNIVWDGLGTHNFTPFKDPRPDVPPEERYKAVGRGVGRKNTLHGFVSADGLRWNPVAADPVFTEGRFDSQNLAFWDPNRRKYRCYYRTPYQGVRGIGVVESDDFRNWKDSRLITLDPPDAEHFYTNATLPYFRNPALYLAFPKRFFPRRRRLADHPAEGISEAVLLSSRDGLHFDRTFMEAWVRPGRDRRNWGDRSCMPAWGLLQTAEDEMSVYISQHYRFDTAHMLRGTLRIDGFASAHAGYSGGELVTTTLLCEGPALVLNYATGAGGSLRVEMQSESGEPLAGFSLVEGRELYGDAIAEDYRWQAGGDLSTLAGRRVRIRFALKDCDLYSYRFAA